MKNINFTHNKTRLNLESSSILKGLLIAFFIIGLPYSCADLEEAPFSELTPNNYFQNKENLEAAITGMYDALYSDREYFFLLWPACSGPSSATMTRFPSNENNTGVYTYMTYNNTTNFSKRLWVQGYSAIMNANTIIENADKASDLTQAEIENYIAEARWMRAFNYFWLVRFLGDVPLHLTTGGSASTDNTSLPRSPVAEVYKEIVADLQYAETRLPVTRPSSENTRPTIGSAKALLGEVYLQMAGLPLQQTENYQLAADKLLEVVQSGTYSLVDSYTRIFDVDNEFNEEVIVGFSFPQVDDFQNLFAWGLSAPGYTEFGGFMQWGFTGDFFDSFDASDSRANVSAMREYTHYLTGENIVWNEPDTYTQPRNFDPIVYDESTGLGTSKFRANADNFILRNETDLILIRYADVLLMLAEAYVGSGNSAAALPYINQVRQRAGIPPLASVTLDDIKQERLWELSGEFQEYPDLQRWGDLEQAVLDGPQSSQTGYNPRNELWPIHIDILNGNKNLTQNPGW